MNFWPELLRLKNLVTLSFIELLYWIGLGAIVWNAVSAIRLGLNLDSARVLIWTVLSTVVAVLLWRVICEVTKVIFQIKDTLIEIRDRQNKA